MIDEKNITNPGRGRWTLSPWQKITAIALLGGIFAWTLTWVLRHRGPQPAQAHRGQTSTLSRPAVQQEEVSFVHLPKVPGRHDRIAKDFFRFSRHVDAGELAESQHQASTPVLTLPQANADVPDEEIEDDLCLKAIMVAQLSKALINDELVTLGDILLTIENSEREYQVVAINEDSVVLKHGTTEKVLVLSIDEK
jgi:hypothetical protein